MANTPAPIAAQMSSQGNPTPVSLLDIQTISGQRYYFSDAPITAYSPLSAFDPDGIKTVQYLEWLITPPSFKITSTLVTSTAQATFQNVSGNTVQRDGAMIFTQQQLSGGLFVYRLWNAAAEWASLTFMGNISSAEIDDADISLSLSSWLNFSKITAPDCQVSANCQNTFRSQQCGATSTDPCLNSYGNCRQINRFKGVITQWNSSVVEVSTNSGIAQPAPILAANLRRPS